MNHINLDVFYSVVVWLNKSAWEESKVSDDSLNDDGIK